MYKMVFLLSTTLTLLFHLLHLEFDASALLCARRRIFSLPKECGIFGFSLFRSRHDDDDGRRRRRSEGVHAMSCVLSFELYYDFMEYFPILKPKNLNLCDIKVLSLLVKVTGGVLARRDCKQH